MHTNVLTPLKIFNVPQHLVVPLFQRPYVWDEENQWAPLWQDVRRTAELRLDDPSSAATHFLGAIVLQAQPNPTGTLQLRQVIDGQQRLTTLQLLMDAAAGVLESLARDKLARRLEGLTENSDEYVDADEDVVKVQHTNRDRSGYHEVMRAEPPVDHASLEHADSLLVRAHRYFGQQVASWLGEETDPVFPQRASVLTGVLTQGLQLVVIDLEADENSQEIFETLNARGTPLTAADLVKNLVFQRLAAEGIDTRRAYEEEWPFESSFWEREVSAGRYLVSRSSLFLNQWLVSRLGEEISPKQTFPRFKQFVEHSAGASMAVLLPVLRQQAELYENWTRRAADPHADLGAVELSVYRSQAAQLELLKPVLIWLHEPGAEHDPAVVDRVVRAVESWVFRRSLLRLTTADLGRVVADLIRTHRSVPSVELPARVEAFLSRLGSVSSHWPGDEAVRRALATEAAYRRFSRARLRVYLEAVEDHFRGYTGTSPRSSARVSRGKYPIEHLLPQKWETHWDVEEPAAKLVRNEHVHRLGNLTLLTQALNSAVSNGPWSGPKGKRARLRDHDLFLMNRRVEDVSVDGWDEARIDERTAALTEALLATWPVPDGHVGEVEDASVEPAASVGLPQLIATGLLAPGTVLSSRAGAWGEREAIVLDNGHLTVDGHEFGSPSAAGRHVRKGATNGWAFWRLADGRRLADLRKEYQTRRVAPEHAE